ncbi:hypothetical protein AB0E69_03290 [Kribbella sp. NPDC026611]|uniref:hypothetical protein n=1 Tax=Kribbella sp. NPDC026611 TaxID=3154911 RepID=UPI003407A009
MAEEAVTTLHAELARFGRAEEAFALLEVFLQVAGERLGVVELDPVGLRLPEEMTDDRGVVLGLIEEIEREPLGNERVAKRGFDMADEQARWDYVRLAYCSAQATVWSRRQRTTYFEAVAPHKATYWLPDSLKAEYFAALTARDWTIPADWLTAIPKRPKPWWKRGGS